MRLPPCPRRMPMPLLPTPRVLAIARRALARQTSRGAAGVVVVWVALVVVFVEAVVVIGRVIGEVCVMGVAGERPWPATAASAGPPAQAQPAATASTAVVLTLIGVLLSCSGRSPAGCECRLGSLGAVRDQSDEDGLGCRCAALLSLAVERDQRVRLREVGCRVTAGAGIGDDAEAGSPPFDPIVGDADQVDDVTVRHAELGQVVRIDEHHPPARMNPAVAVVETVDRGVVLVV